MVLNHKRWGHSTSTVLFFNWYRIGWEDSTTSWMMLKTLKIRCGKRSFEFEQAELTVGDSNV